MERPGLLGPRNEKIEEIAPPAGGLSYKQSDRPLWQAVDDKSGCPSEMSKDVENVGPFGEARDDGDVGPLGETRDDGNIGPLGETRDDEEEVGPFGETRDGDDGLRQDDDDGAQQKEGEGEQEVTDDEDINHAIRLAAKAVSTLSEMLANTGTSTTSSTASSIEPGASLTSSSRTLSSTPPTTSRKRTRDSEEDPEKGAKDEESPSQQKRRRMDKALGIERTSSLQQKQMRMDGILGIKRTSSSQQKRKRMDGILGIERKDANAANNTQSVGTAMKPDLLVQQPRKRARACEDEAVEGENPTEPKRARLQLNPPKRARLHLNPPKPTRLNLTPIGDASDEEAQVADGAPKKDEPTVVRQPISNNDVHNPVAVDKETSVEVHTQTSVEEVAFANEETNNRNDTAADDEIVLSQEEWNTAHGINSIGANIPVDGMDVLDLTGEKVRLCLPTSKALSPYRFLTEKEKEDLRTYIQDYGVQDWHVLAKCMNSTVRGIKTEYLEYIVARNRQAGRRELAGIHAWPQLAPPPSPPPLPKPDKQKAAPGSTDPAATSEP